MIQLMDRSFHALSEHMGELLGPRPLAEVVITLYEDERLNYQIEGMNGPVAPGVVFKLLRAVGAEVFRQMSPDEQAQYKEAPK